MGTEAKQSVRADMTEREMRLLHVVKDWYEQQEGRELSNAEAVRKMVRNEHGRIVLRGKK